MKDEPFQTEDYGLAAYLVYKGMHLIATAPTSTYRRVFLLADHDNREEWVDYWENRKEDGKMFRDYFSKIQVVKRSLRDAEMQLEHYKA